MAMATALATATTVAIASLRGFDAFMVELSSMDLGGGGGDLAFFRAHEALVCD